MEDIKQVAKIKCPHCGWEYVPCEIFYPEDFTGKSTSIIKDALGKILYTEYDPEKQPLETEHFVCENCGQEFTVEPIISFKVSKLDEEVDFKNQSVSLF